MHSHQISQFERTSPKHSWQLRGKHSPFLPKWACSRGAGHRRTCAAQTRMETSSTGSTENLPLPPTALNLENVQVIRSALYIQVTNETKDTGHSTSFLWSLEILDCPMNSGGGSHGNFSFMILLIFFSRNMLFPSHSWPLSHLGLSLLSWWWDTRKQAQAPCNQGWHSALF